MLFSDTLNDISIAIQYVWSDKKKEEILRTVITSIIRGASRIYSQERARADPVLGPVLEDTLELEWYRDPKGGASIEQLTAFTQVDVQRMTLAMKSYNERRGNQNMEDSVRSMYGISDDVSLFRPDIDAEATLSSIKQHINDSHAARQKARGASSIYKGYTASVRDMKMVADPQYELECVDVVSETIEYFGTVKRVFGEKALFGPTSSSGASHTSVRERLKEFKRRRYAEWEEGVAVKCRDDEERERAFCVYLRESTKEDWIRWRDDR